MGKRRLQLDRKSTAELQTFVGLPGEPILNKDTKRTHFHDGVTPGGIPALSTADVGVADGVAAFNDARITGASADATAKASAARAGAVADVRGGVAPANDTLAKLAGTIAVAAQGTFPAATLAELNTNTTALQGTVDSDGLNNGTYARTVRTDPSTPWVKTSGLTVQALDARATKTDRSVGDVAARTRRRVLMNSPLLAQSPPTDSISVGDVLVSMRDGQGRELLPQAGAPRRAFANAEGVTPLFGVSDPAGAFVGITSDQQLRARIDVAYSRMGRTLAHPAIPDAEIIETDAATGAVRRATSRKGGVTDFAAGNDPILATEWMNAAGTRVAPFTADARELVVAYMPNGERRVLTPYGAFHFRAPRLAYGSKSVRAFKCRDGQAVGEIYAVSMDGSGFMAPDDPLLLTAFTSDGQSLGQGSGGLADFLNAWRTVLYPEHTLTLDNTVKPGDNRLGRNATVVDAVLDPATLGGLVAIKPQPGVASVHVYTPGEALILLLQEKIVRKLGRPQRLCAITLGIGGQPIAAIGSGTQNETNRRAAQTALVARAAERGWRVEFHALWHHAESDATNLTATYQAAYLDYQSRCAVFEKGLSGQTRDPVWVISQNSSTGEDADNETTSIGALAFAALMRSDPVRNLVFGPDYPYQAFYAPTDYQHFLNEGYFRKTEVACAAFAHQVWGCGGRPGLPLYLIGASYAPGSTAITLQWSRPIVRDVVLVPVRPMDGIEVATASGQFLTIDSHSITAGATTSIITLSAALTTAQQASARVQVGMLGQETPRVGTAVPGTNIRAAHSHDTAEIDGRPIYPFALHDRLPLTII